MYVRPRARFRPRNAGGAPFSPAMLFTGGTVGAWYDPSDYSTLFQDSAGATPVTAVEQPVRLMLDKSQGLVLGSELVTNGDFATDTWWIKSPGVTISGGECSFSSVSAGTGVYKDGILTIGRWYLVTYTIKSISSGAVRIWTTGVIRNSAGTFTEYYQATTANFGILGNSNTPTATAVIDNVSVKELPGNHALAPNDASRPVLRARYNLLTYSEQFDNAAWTTTSATVSANTTATTDPLGGNTADSLIASAASSQHRIYQAVTSSDYTLSVYAKAGTASFISLSRSSTSAYATFNLSTGVVSASAGGTATIQSAGNGWWRCAIASTVATSYLQIAVGNTAANAEPNVAWLGAGENVYIWGAQAVTGSSAGTYQRIAAATDYATAGFLPYLYFVTDDSFSTGAINLSGTDKVSVITGYTKLSDSAVGMLYELGIDPTTTNGTFNFVAPQSTVDGSYRINVRGTTTVQVNTAARAAPVTDVSSMLANIAGPSVTVRLNGAVAASSTSSMGTGNFANTALYIGRRNNSNFPINGNFYGYILCGKALSASELSATESWMATKTGVTL